jgi:hypothetical protein
MSQHWPFNSRATQHSRVRPATSTVPNSLSRVKQDTNQPRGPGGRGITVRSCNPTDNQLLLRASIVFDTFRRVLSVSR